MKGLADREAELKKWKKKLFENPEEANSIRSAALHREEEAVMEKRLLSNVARGRRLCRVV